LALAPQARVAITADARSSHDEAGVVVPQLAWKLEVRDDDLDAAMPEFAPDGKWERLGRGQKVGNFTFSQHRVISFYCAAQDFFTGGNRAVYRGYRCYRWSTQR
jgi:hypothetical protein